MRHVAMGLLLMLALVGAQGTAGSAQGTAGIAAPMPEPPAVPGVPSIPQLPGASTYDQQRALRELTYALERVAAVAGHARLNEDTQALLAMARRYLNTAQAHYDAGRFYQSAETASAIVKLTDAIKHLYWAQAGSR